MDNKIKNGINQFYLMRPKISVLIPILLGLTFGLIISFGYILWTPKHYMTSVIISLPSILNEDLEVVQTEEPKMFLKRLPDLIESDNLSLECPTYYENNQKALDFKKIIFEVNREFPSVIELKVTSLSPSSAVKCADAFFYEIKKLRDIQVNKYSNSINSYLAANENAIKELRSEVVQDRGTAVDQLIFREKLYMLLDNKRELQKKLLALQRASPALLTPIKTPASSSMRNIKMVLLVGIVLGLFSGGIITATMRILARIRNN